MTKEKNIDTSKQADKFADERLSDEQLDGIAGGIGGGTSYKCIQNLFGSAGSRENQDGSAGSRENQDLLEFLKAVSYK